MISIIIPIYNSEPYIEKCLDSITKQTYKDLELICVDDNSTDNTPSMLRDFANKDSRIKIITNDATKGISESRNKGLEVARGEWIMFVDSDDWMELDCCLQAMEIARQSKADTVMWCYVREFETKSLPKVFETKKRIWEGKEVGHLRRRMFGPYHEELSRPDLLDAWGTIWGKLYSRQVIKSGSPTTFVDTNIVGTAEDVIFNIDYLAKAKKVVYEPHAWYHYRKSMESYSNRHRADLISKWDKLYNEMEQRIKEQHLGNDFQMALQNRIALGTLGLSIISFRSKGSLMNKYKELKKILNKERQHNALQKLELNYFAPHWKVYYFAAKHKIMPLFMPIQMVINKMIDK